VKERSERTRARILEAALALFRERGFEGTTMRAVASAAGVSLGNAYYYFESKEHLLHAYYDRIRKAHEEAARLRVEGERDLGARIRRTMEAKLDVIEPYHRFSALLFRAAADPKSPLNPFHAANARERAAETALYRSLLEGAKPKVPEEFREEVAEQLWLWNMGIVLFWIHDGSEGRRRTRLLVDRSSALVARLLGLFANPFLLPLRRAALQMLRDLREPPGPP